MCRLFYLHASENMKKRSLHVVQKEKIGLSHTVVFAYLYLFVYMRELVNASSLFSLLTLTASNFRCVCNIQKIFVQALLFDRWLVLR
jgi:hypothetical protein